MTTTVEPRLLEEMRQALEEAGREMSVLMRQVTDPARPAIGTWTIGETARHVAGSAEYFLRAARGEGEPERLGDVAAGNARALAEDPERDPRVLVTRYRRGITDLAGYAGSVAGDPVAEPFAGVRVPLSTVLAVELGETLVHGFDIARAAGLPWRIGTLHAILTHEGYLPLLPFMLNAERAAGLRLRAELRIRGMARQLITIDDGELRAGPSSGQPADFRLAADPVVYLLLSWHRISPWLPMLRGQMAVWGRRPWLLPAFQAAFTDY